MNTPQIFNFEQNEVRTTSGIDSALAYEQILINSFRYLRINNISDIERMTLYEYNIRMTAAQLSWLDKEKLIHELAWANQQVQAEKKVGKKTVPVYRSFEEFFNYFVCQIKLDKSSFVT
ncbi:hypothetical protein EB33_01712 [Enterococcus faecium]|uniref:hypothetical protein n=1 Tax=Enterococcus faecium TaxID=1352 RepID=UPI000E056713|nr:hypothetical protein [Enterococcus faecium]RBS56525.1 hypothetical protein EB33_01712 [Enterococcus faecium]